MIEPNAQDVGRAVLYRPAVGPEEVGVITSFNRSFVFVRYTVAGGGIATLRRDLHWPDGIEEDNYQIASRCGTEIPCSKP